MTGLERASKEAKWQRAYWERSIKKRGSTPAKLEALRKAQELESRISSAMG